MNNTIKATCWFCGKNFVIRDGREWKYLCSKCFHYVYEILGVKERPLELKNNWPVIMKRTYTEKPQYFNHDVRERLKTQGILDSY